MDDKIIAAVIGLLAGGLGSLAAPWVNWGIEKKKERLQHRRELITKWRELVHNFSLSPGLTVGSALINQRDYSSLQPHLPEPLRNFIYQHRYTSILENLENIEDMIVRLNNEIARIERGWGLI
jgi:hypothetical protein